MSPPQPHPRLIAVRDSAIACLKNVAECGLASHEMRAWLAMMVESPLAS